MIHLAQKIWKNGKESKVTQILSNTIGNFKK